MANLRQASDFPTPNSVEEGHFYYTLDPVIDNDPSRTNTGQSFSPLVWIWWDGIQWVELTGTSSLPASSVTFDPTGTIFTATDVQALGVEISNEVAAKTDKVVPSVAGNFVSFLNALGDQADSGVSPADYYTTSQFINLSTGVPDAGKPIVLDATGQIDPSMYSAGSGEANTASNLGVGNGIYANKVGVDLQFKSLIAGSNVTLTPGVNDITIAASGGGGVALYDKIIDAAGGGDYTSIATAVATEAANTTFFIKAGTYNETANITMKSGQKLYGEDFSNTIIDFGGTNSKLSVASNCEFHRFVVKRGLSLSGGNIDINSVSNVKCSFIEIDGVTVSSEGVSIGASSNLDLHFSKITGCIVSAFNCQSLEDSIIFIDKIISNNSSSGQHASQIIYCDRNYFFINQINNNVGGGITIVESDNNVFKINYIASNYSGIRITDSLSNKFDIGDSSNNTIYGLYLTGTNYNYFIGGNFGVTQVGGSYDSFNGSRIGALTVSGDYNIFNGNLIGAITLSAGGDYNMFVGNRYDSVSDSGTGNTYSTTNGINIEY